MEIIVCPLPLSMTNSAARCQLFKFNSISVLSNSIFNIIGLARTSQQYHQRFLWTDKNYNFYINFIKMLLNILQIKPIFGDFVIWCRFSMLFDSGLSIVRSWLWVYIRCRFDILKYRAALMTNKDSYAVRLAKGVKYPN